MRWVYPRACGGTPAGKRPLCRSSGLSPRVRGNQRHISEHPLIVRSIPARAGEPGSRVRPRPHRPVYPRACGGTLRMAVLYFNLYGLSPRVRGNLFIYEGRKLHLRSIPARAGEPRWVRRGLGPRWVYPRACGEPPCIPQKRACCRVYPRACGGTALGPEGVRAKMGLSPRVRGTSLYPTKTCVLPGLSPRVRGNLPGCSCWFCGAGSIPARAGEPRSRWRR